MSPRPAPTPHDDTGQQFLAAAARLIDEYLGPIPAGQSRSGRLRQIKFPAALEWLRVQDVIRMAAATGAPGTSRSAFMDRWPTKDSFLPDAVVYALLREHTADDPQEYVDQALEVISAPTTLSDSIIQISDGLLAALQRHPRSYIVLHLGPLLPKHPDLWAAVLPYLQSATQTWADAFESILGGLGLTLRPEWDFRRASFVLQALLDGFVLRYRVQPDDYPMSRWEGASAYADAVIAFMLGAVDWEQSSEVGRATLDRLVSRI